MGQRTNDLISEVIQITTIVEKNMIFVNNYWTNFDIVMNPNAIGCFHSQGLQNIWIH